jgi:Fe-Mn family superoxide dismutase
LGNKGFTFNFKSILNLSYMNIKILGLLLFATLMLQCKSLPVIQEKNVEVQKEITVQAFQLPKTPEGVIHTFKALPYAYNALEPYIDAQTMEIHFSRHHVTYYTKFLEAIKGTELEKMEMNAIFSKMTDYSVAVRNNGGGYWNHEFFWNLMIPGGAKEPVGNLAKAIDATFGSFEAFKNQFSDTGLKRFGSGWAWLSVDKDGKLLISSTANQDNPMMNTEKTQATPIITIDVWEHAYYLKYQNKRADYLDAFWNVVNWDIAEKRFNATK